MGGESHRPRYEPPKLQRAERADIPDLARVWINAEKGNLVHKLQWPSKKDAAKLFIKMLNIVIDVPQILCMKAIDVETNVISAFAIWQFHGYDLHTENLKSTLQHFGAAGILMANSEDDPYDPDPLGKYINDEFKEFFHSWFKSTKFISVAWLMTDPQFQRRGIGTALMQFGHNIADQEGTLLALIASPVGHPLYNSLGWKDISTGLTLNLTEWVPWAKNGDQGWGVYRFYYMLRLPLRVVEKTSV
jgi:GNAT superfamily N-acetyltransferase